MPMYDAIIVMLYRMGSALIGTIMSSLLLGVTYVQTFYYYTSATLDITKIMAASICEDYPKDYLYPKLLVCTNRGSLIVAHYVSSRPR